jgi:hypothetical protein
MDTLGSLGIRKAHYFRRSAAGIGMLSCDFSLDSHVPYSTTFSKLAAMLAAIKSVGGGIPRWAPGGTLHQLPLERLLRVEKTLRREMDSRPASRIASIWGHP